MSRKHSDNLNNLVIASVSLGAERTFIMSPRLPSKNARGRAKVPVGALSIAEETEDLALEQRASHKWK